MYANKHRFYVTCKLSNCKNSKRQLIYFILMFDIKWNNKHVS